MLVRASVHGVCVCIGVSLYGTHKHTANNILRLAADGRILLYFCPPGYSSSKGAQETELWTPEYQTSKLHTLFLHVGLPSL